jgi:hypothetical protein
MHLVTAGTVPLPPADAESPAGPGHFRGPTLGADAITILPAAQPGHELRTILRRPPVRLADGRVEGGETARIELTCRGCDDQAGLDYAEVLARHQQLRGPRRLGPGPAEYAEHLGLAS